MMDRVQYAMIAIPCLAAFLMSACCFIVLISIRDALYLTNSILQKLREDSLP